MNQVFETQLQVVQRALGDVIAPALASAESYVIEQLQLSIVTLAFMQERLPYARRYFRDTVASYIAMAEAIVQLMAKFDAPGTGHLDALVIKGRILLNCPEAEIANYREFLGELRVSIATLVTTAENADYESALDALIMDLSGPILLQERIWCVPLGFELRPQDLPEPKWKRQA